MLPSTMRTLLGVRMQLLLTIIIKVTMQKQWASIVMLGRKIKVKIKDQLVSAVHG